uniref:DUF3223 domain-containing protein n=1 Tax=Steinernema glaseri TaxID=37863 RepID=A0A1I8AEQ5_9BILA
MNNAFFCGAFPECNPKNWRTTYERVHVAPHTTMDAVPFKFVDSVVELFGKKTLDQLAREVRHPLWKDVVDLHHLNRVYYSLVFRKAKHGTMCLFFDEHDYCSVSVQTIRKNRRFA